MKTKFHTFTKRLSERSLIFLGSYFILAIFVALVWFRFGEIILETTRGDAVETDFVNYYVGAQIVRRGNGRDLYNSELNKAFQKEFVRSEKTSILTYRSLPFVAVLFLPFTFFDLDLAYKIFALLNAVFLVLLTYLVIKIVPMATKRAGLLIFASPLFLPNFIAIRMGQLSILLGLIIAGIFLGIKSKHNFLVGLFTSMLFIRPQFLTLVPFVFLLVVNKRKFLAGFVAGCFVLIAASVLVSGAGPLLSYPEFIIQTESPQFGSRPEIMDSILGFLANNLRPFETYGLLLTIVNFSAYCALLFVFRTRLTKSTKERLFSTAIILSVIFAMHVLVYDLSVLIVALFLVLEEALKRRVSILLEFTLVLLIFSLLMLGAMKHIVYLPIVLLAYALWLLLGSSYTMRPHVRSD